MESTTSGNSTTNATTTIYPNSTTTDLPINTTTFPPVTTTVNASVVEKCLCKTFLEDDLGESGVKYWDLALLCPQICFMTFLILTLKSSALKLSQSKSPLLTLMYVLIWIDTGVAIIRAIAAVAMKSSVERGDQLLWLCLNFFFVATETAVLAFAVLFGHLDSAKGVRRVVVTSLTVASVSTIIMTSLEMSTSYSTTAAFHHGTMPFTTVSTLIFLIIYCLILTLPFSPWRDRFMLPSKKSFYIYCAVFAVIDLIQLLGAILVLSGVLAGYCLLDFTVFTYMTLLPAAVYFVYLRGFFTRPPLTIPFSIDEDPFTIGEDGNETNTSLPSPQQRHLAIQFDDSEEVQFSSSKFVDVPFRSDPSTMPSMSL